MEDYKKKYDELLLKLQKAKVDDNVCDERYCCVIDDIVPELKESEDEKIRKELIAFLKEMHETGRAEKTWSLSGIERWIAWLEKQGEQKLQGNSALEAINEEKVDNTNKVEPKSEFKVGDWIVHNSSNNLYKIVSFDSGYCSLIDIEGTYYNPCICPNGDYHLWNLSDVKNGGILYSSSLHLIWIYKDNETAHICVNMNYVKDNVFTEGLIVIPEDACPANKLQRDILFSKIKEAGYEWDADKKELKKIEQKPAWSEEDEKMLQGIWDEIIANKHDAKEYEWKTYDKFLDWLKSLKDRVLPQPKQEWSEEDEQITLSIEQVMNCASLLNIVPEKLNKINKWLKSLKQRYTWKPSDEQMEALEHFVRSVGESGYASPYDNNTKLLYSILSDLKKLKG